MNAFAENAFDWVPFYSELADKLVPLRTRQQELIAFVEELRAEGLKVTQLDDKDAAGNRFLLIEIDPFTFFAIFNRGITNDQRIRILTRIKARFGVSAPVPSHFDGIPVMNNQKSWFFSYQDGRALGDIEKLWEVFERALEPEPFANPALAAAFDTALGVRQTSLNLTMGLFWIRPQTFLGLDKIMRGALNIALPKSGLNFGFYRKTVEAVRGAHGSDFPRLSADAWLKSQSEERKPQTLQGSVNNDINYWMVGAFWDSEDPPDQTDRFLSEGVWENGYEDRYLDLVKAMKVGDRIAIKAAATQKHDLPFNNGGKTASLMRIKVIGTILPNHGDGRTVQVEWDAPFAPPRTWYFYTSRSTVWRLRKDDDLAQALISFAFRGEGQDYAYFIGALSDKPTKDLPTIEINSEQVAVADQAPPYAIADLMSDGVFLTEEEVERALKRLRVKRNLILQGAPGVGKTFLAKRLAYALMQAKDDSRIAVVQFHPSFTYEDFVRGYRPSADIGKFNLVDGPFLKLCRRADEDRDREYVLIIDEINRGNVSQIFGELTMLLEADKRGREHAVTPLYQQTDDERMHIPANLYVIGTMNVADRSLALVDYALRRRFAFFTLEPQFDSQLYRGWLKNRGMSDALIQRIVTRMKALNTKIADDPQLGDSYRVGHSFFCPSGKDFSSLDDAWYSDVVVTEIKPLLEAYWYDARDRAKAACDELLG